jgi:hypothetical protein
MSCTNNCDATGITIPTGDDGNDGTDGVHGGFSREFLFDSSTSTGPSSGDFRFDNATLSSVTKVYISDTDNDSADVDAFLDQFTNSSDFGLIMITEVADPGNFWAGTITANSDNGSDHTVTATHVDSAGSFTNNNAYVISFTPAGAASSDAGGLLHVDDTTSTATGASITTFSAAKTYTLAAGQVGTNGDELIVRAMFNKGGSTDDAYLYLYVNGSDVHGSAAHPYYFLPSTGSAIQIEIRLRRTSTTNFTMESREYVFSTSTTSATIKAFNDFTVACADLDASTNAIELRAQMSGATDTVNCKSYTIEFNPAL